MANISQRNGRWRAEVCVDRRRRAKTFDLKRQAVAWAREQEEKGVTTRHTFGDLLEEYSKFNNRYKDPREQAWRLGKFRSVPFYDVPLEDITPQMLGAWRDKRMTEVAQSSVLREIATLSPIFRHAVTELQWVASNPLALMKKPRIPSSRKRGITAEEEQRMISALEQSDRGSGKLVASIFRFSLETGMRQGEILGLRWGDVTDRTAILRDTKNGSSRVVPLSPKAREILDGRRLLMGASCGTDSKIFPILRFTLQWAFRKARESAGIEDLHFHDARGEAITRLSKKLGVLQLAEMIGHHDINSLMFYYSESAESIADRL